MKGVVIPRAGSVLATGATPEEMPHSGEEELHQVILYLSRDWSVLGLGGGAQYTFMSV